MTENWESEGGAAGRPLPKWVLWRRNGAHPDDFPTMILLAEDAAARYAEMYPDDIIFYARAADHDA